MLSTNDNTHSPWPTVGNNPQFLMMDIPGLTVSLRKDILRFIAINCCITWTTKENKFLVVKGMSAPSKTIVDPIVLDSLFKKAVGKAADNPSNLDTFRFQTNPRWKHRLMECSSIKILIQLVNDVVNTMWKKEYFPNNISVLYSRPFGDEQDLHFDDFRAIDVIEKEGPMITAIVGLLNDTKLDIEGNDKERKTYSIPAGAMFLFSGTCVHGGSSYTVCNTRIHIEFLPTPPDDSNPSEANLIPTNETCPIDNCPHIKHGKLYTEAQLYYHWDRYHVKEEGLSLKKYRSRKAGEIILQCQSCRKGFLTKEGLDLHKHRCRVRISK
jgi:hypothetical protein